MRGRTLTGRRTLASGRGGCIAVASLSTMLSAMASEWPHNNSESASLPVTSLTWGTASISTGQLATLFAVYTGQLGERDSSFDTLRPWTSVSLPALRLCVTHRKALRELQVRVRAVAERRVACPGEALSEAPVQKQEAYLPPVHLGELFECPDSLHLQLCVFRVCVLSTSRCVF